MGKCIYCGKPAGFLRRYHRECREKHDRAAGNIRDLLVAFFNDGGDIGDVVKLARETVQNGYIRDDEFFRLVFETWKLLVERAFDDGILTEAEEERLRLIINGFGLNVPEVLNSRAYSLIEKGAFLRELLDGRLPANLPDKSILPFNFLKSETPLWVFQDVDYYEMVTRKKYTGGYSGFSIRIARGLYWRVGGFRGKPVVTQELKKVDHGTMVVTTKHIYFGGQSKIFRVRLDRIVAFEPFEDGVGIQRDARTAKPQYFVTGDGWFTYNLLRNATNVQ